MANLLCVSHEWNLGFDELRDLSNAGFYLVSAASGLEAINHFAMRPIDAVIVNRRLPDISIENLAFYFRHHKPNLPIVMISTAMPVADAPSCLDAIIQKHNCASLLLPTLQVLLSRGADRPDATGAFAEVA